MIFLILVSLAIPQADQDDFAQRAWGHFSRNIALEHHQEIVDIATDGKSPDHLEYRLRLKDQKLGSPLVVSWADSRTCPAVQVVLRRLRVLSPPTIVPPGFPPEPSEIIVDGSGYGLTVPVADTAGASKITWTSNIGTPLAAWIDSSLVELEPCWREKPAH